MQVHVHTIGDGSVLNYLHHLILPSIVLSLVHVAIWSRDMRTATLDAISQDFGQNRPRQGLERVLVIMNTSSAMCCCR